MAQKFWEGEFGLDTLWGGDESTGFLPVSGERVQGLLRDKINSKAGYVGRVEKATGSFYVMARDEETFNRYLETITDENPKGNLTMDGIDNRWFEAPFNYKMSITLLSPEGGYASALADSTGNTIKFKAESQDNSGSPQQEGITVTYRIKTEAGAESTYVQIYNYNTASRGIEFSLDGKLAVGSNTITITAVGDVTGVAAMRRVTYRLVDISFKDNFNIRQRYAFEGNVLDMSVTYSLKGIGKTSIEWRIDDEKFTDEIEALNPIISSGSHRFFFTQDRYSWLTIGKHRLQVSMTCYDPEGGEYFHSPIYYREFVVEDTPTVMDTPVILRCLEIPYDKGFVASNDEPKLYGVKQYTNVEMLYAAYYNGKSECQIDAFVKGVKESEYVKVSSDTLALIDGFSELVSFVYTVNENDALYVKLSAIVNGQPVYDTETGVEVDESDMNISTVTEDVTLYLNAFGRSNNASDRNEWKYVQIDEVTGEETEIITEFSNNEYVDVSSEDILGNIIPPVGIDTASVLEYEGAALPTEEQEGYDYLHYNNRYYAWNREFDWSSTSGWSDGKLKLSNGNQITINYAPLAKKFADQIKTRGITLEFELETTDVYNDDAVICRICGGNNFSPGISIYASGADMMIDRNNEKGVSVKYKSEESVRLSFVVTPDSDAADYRERLMYIYVDGIMSGAYAYTHGETLLNDSIVSFRGNKDASINLLSMKFYNRALSSDEILGNFIYYKTDSEDKINTYKRNDIVLESDKTQFDPDKLKSQIPVMTFYQINENETIYQLHQEVKNKKLAKHFDIFYEDVQNPSRNFVIKNARVTPQGTSSMAYPVKNFRIYSKKEDSTRLYVGENIFLDPSSKSLSDDNLNPDALVPKRKYSFINNAIPVSCWCLKADFAESSSANNTATARYWNEVLKNAGLKTKAQIKAEQYQDKYPYDIRTCVNGFPIVLFYQPLGNTPSEFQGKYNFNNDKSTEDVFGFTGGIEIPEQPYLYYYIGKNAPYISDPKEASALEGGYTLTPNADSPLFTSDSKGNWYMLRGKSLLDNPKMECWEILNSVNEVALFTSAARLKVDDEKVGTVLDGGAFDGAFESRFPDSGSYFHTNSLERFIKWVVSCRYLKVDSNGISVPYTKAEMPIENWHLYRKDGDTYTALNDNWTYSGEKYLKIQSLTKKGSESADSATASFAFNFPGKNFYKEANYDAIKSELKEAGYSQISLSGDVLALKVDSIEGKKEISSYTHIKIKNTETEDITYTEYIWDDATSQYVEGSIEGGEALEVAEMPTDNFHHYGYLFDLSRGIYWQWMPANYLVCETLPDIEQSSYKFVKVGEKYYKWDNLVYYQNYWEPQYVEDNPENRALKFAIEKWDHIQMKMMASYYIYLMKFGGVDQTVKNAMLTTEGCADSSDDSATSELPSLWYFILYDNDTIMGLKNDGRLKFGPYITRETKDGDDDTAGYVYAGRESTLWNNLEADDEFMKTVTEVDNMLASGTNTANNLSYANAIKEYTTNQTDKWCERIYNRDAERKYVNTFVKGWTQVNGDSTTTVYENYMYDIQGSRESHRKWWLSRRLNVFDSKFTNANYMSQMVRFRSTNLPAGSIIRIKSGEPVYYAWGHDNIIVAKTQKALQPNEETEFVINSTYNIGSYLEVLGSANLITLDLRGCVGAISELDVKGCYSTSIGTKLKELLIGNKDSETLINKQTDNLKFSGLEVLEKLEKLDMTNITNLDSLSGLENLYNIKEVYAKGTRVSNFTFADGAKIKKIELPTKANTLYLSRTPMINFSNISFENNDMSALRNLSIINCTQMMKDTSFIFKWINTLTPAAKAESTITLQGIDWTLDRFSYSNLWNLNGFKKINITGKIFINSTLSVNEVSQLKAIFGDNCFKEGSAVYITVPNPAIFISAPEYIYEGSGTKRCIVSFIGTALDGEINASAVVNGANGERISPSETNGIITVDTSNVIKEYADITILESDENYESITISISYFNGVIEIVQNQNIPIRKRIYPTEARVVSDSDSYKDKIGHNVWLEYMPSELNDTTFEGRGIFSVAWEITEGSLGYDSVDGVSLLNKNEETAIIKSPTGEFDGTVTLNATITKTYNNEQLTGIPKTIEFKNTNTILTKQSNSVLYQIMVDNGIIVEVGSGNTKFGKLTKNQASLITIDRFINEDGVSIFKGNTALTSFAEMQYFNSSEMGTTTVPDEMFAGCTNLKEIVFSTNFHKTSKNMFAGCKNLETVIGAVVGNPELPFEFISDGCFSGCSACKEITLRADLSSIGANAFSNCTSLEKVICPVGNVSIGSNPFTNCPNVSFEGAEYGGTVVTTLWTKNGALFQEITNSDGEKELNLIHMGKDTLMSDLPTDITINALTYSMEYRTESNPIIPSNVTFNGGYILYKSTGDTITLQTVFGETSGDNIFRNTKYNKCILCEGETRIPSYCFYETEIVSIEIPEGVKTIDSWAFEYSTKIQAFTFPSTLESFGQQSMWRCDSLKNITFMGATAPKIAEGDLFNVSLDNIWVLPENFYQFRNGLMQYLRPYVRPLYLYTEGYVRIIKDGTIVLPDESNIITVGGLDVTIAGDYVKYTIENGTHINDFNIILNGKVVGQVVEPYTTIFIGNNSSLFTGDGIDFTTGIYDDEVNKAILGTGWEYDKRFQGLKVNSDSKYANVNIELTIPSMESSITYGLYGESFTKATLLNSANDAVLEISNKVNYFTTSSFAVNEDKILKIQHSRTSTIKTGIESLVIHRIGNTIYCDPSLDESNSSAHKITISIVGNVLPPSGTLITITDGMAHNYQKVWDGENTTMEFIVPKGFTLYAEAIELLTDSGKYYAKPIVEITDDIDAYELAYIPTSGKEINGNILTYMVEDTDYYINLSKMPSSTWGTNNIDIPAVNCTDITQSVNDDGFVNTKAIVLTDTASTIFSKALSTTAFGAKITGYIPSYTELLTISANLEEINDFLTANGKDIISLEDIWVSETHDNNNAWISDGYYYPKNSLKQYYIFGRRTNI